MSTNTQPIPVNGAHSLPKLPQTVAVTVQKDLPNEWVIVAKTIAQLALSILFPIFALAMAAAVTPLALQAVVLPTTALGTAFLSAFFFPTESFYPPQTVQPLVPLLPAVSVPAAPIQVVLPGPPLPELPAGAPRGIRNLGNNCWLNSNLQLCESDPFIRQWLRTPLPEDNPHFPVRHACVKLFETYDQAFHAGKALATGSSQKVREGLHTAVNRGIHRLPQVQEDAHEGMSALLDDLPNEQKIHFEERTHYDTTGLPAIQGSSDGIRIRDEGDLRPWGIELAMNGHVPKLPEMLRAYCREEIDPRDPDRIELMGVDGDMHRYKRTLVERQFVEAPDMLRITLKRFLYYRPPGANWLSKIPFMTSLFPQLLGCPIKNTSPIEIPLQMEIPLANGTRQNYRLKCFSCHEGQTSETGHYTAFTRRENYWYLTNDAYVCPATEWLIQQTLATGAPYLVWYEKV